MFILLEISEDKSCMVLSLNSRYFQNKEMSLNIIYFTFQLMTSTRSRTSHIPGNIKPRATNILYSISPRHISHPFADIPPYNNTFAPSYQSCNSPYYYSTIGKTDRRTERRRHYRNKGDTSGIDNFGVSVCGKLV